VISAERVSYDAGATYDLLPAGDTGIYWADDVPLASTLTSHAAPETRRDRALDFLSGEIETPVGFFP
jgi:hypothetical protein